MRTKEDRDLFGGRIRDLARRAATNEYVTHTGFLSVSEQADAAAVLSDGGTAGVRFLFYGGTEDAERRILFFLPSYLEEEDLIAQEEAGEGVIACLQARVRGARFTKEIGHRDCLGALMHLGIERAQIGDIFLTPDGDYAFLYVMAAMAEHICRELVSIGRAHVDLSAVPLSACTVRPVPVPQSGSLASVRIDSLIAMVFHISRSAARDLVTREEVFADGRTVRSPSFTPAAGCRISVRGHGRFIYEGEEKTTKRGRIMVRTSVYK